MELLGIRSDRCSVPSVAISLTGMRGRGRECKKTKTEQGGCGAWPIKPAQCHIPLCASPPKSTRSRSTHQRRRPGASSLFPSTHLSCPHPLLSPHNHVRHPRSHPQKLRPEVPLPKGRRIPGRYHGRNLRMSPTFSSPHPRVFTLSL